MKISVIVLAKNEEKNIKECLESLKFCEEMIVIDDNSDDKTREIAKEMGAKVFIRALEGNFAAQRNFGLEQVRGEWVLFVDADEIISPTLRDEIKSEVRSTKFEINGYLFKREDMLWGRKLRYGEVGNIQLLRLARKGSGIWKRRVHEYWDVRGKVGELKNPLLHFPHQTLNEFVKDIEFYSTLHAQQKKDDNERSSIVKIVLWPLAKFTKDWILKGGFLDGVPGLIHALLMSLHSFLAWSKLWLLKH